MATKILIAEDHKIVSMGLTSLIKQESDMEIVGFAQDGESAVRQCKDLCPDVIIMDIGLPKMNGIHATRTIMAECPGTKVIGLSMHSDKWIVKGMMEAGAKGYLLKECAFEELMTAIRTVLANKTYLSPALADA